ncbi:MAG: glycosyltransferase family 2 protein [Selenomonadaceae bacterium]|nr:glycosyltransferase family 2 protein [Selenomonadaceae bacterium]
MKISACYIVKNCAADLERSLKSFAEFVDEIVVVDTGSADSTVAVAESFGAKIFHDEWREDFSAPRNLALSRATGNWIIFLDADEFFANGTGRNLRFAIERAEEFRQQGMLVQLVNVDADAGDKILGADYVLRIFKNHRGLHYFGKIHEELRPALTEVTFVPPQLLTIFHTGYSAGINRAKAERNLKMLLAELAETPEPERIYGYLAESYEGLGDFENAEKFARLDIGAGSKSTRSYRIILDVLSNFPDRLSDRETFAKIAVKKFPALPEFSAELAECYAARENFRDAVAEMTAALAKFKNYRGLEPTTFSAETAAFAARRIKIWKATTN